MIEKKHFKFISYSTLEFFNFYNFVCNFKEEIPITLTK